jgi:hypothetical protein
VTTGSSSDDDVRAATGGLMGEIAQFLTPPATREEANEIWDRVGRGEIPDPTPYGTGYDHCPWCGADWKEPHRAHCQSPSAR